MPDGTATPQDGFTTAAIDAFRDSSLELTILPTEKCNFRCTYCYEDFAIGRMPEAVQDSCIDLVASRAPHLGRLEVRWFGGEPLVARGVVERMSRAFSAIAAEYDALHYDASMTTNAFLLTPELAERLVGWGVRNYQVSLDGPREAHDATRRTADGRGSFDRIMANLYALRDGDLPFHAILRLHLTLENAALMPDFVRLLADDFLHDSRFTLFFMPIAHLGGPADATTPVLRGTQARQLIAELRQVAVEALGEPLAVPDPSEAQAWSVCYAAKPNAFVIRADGRVGKCTVALSQTSNSVGRMHPQGRMEIDQLRHQQWLGGWESRDRDALHCPYEAIDSLHH